jgi:hypothetical protein
MVFAWVGREGGAPSADVADVVDDVPEGACAVESRAEEAIRGEDNVK